MNELFPGYSDAEAKSMKRDQRHRHRAAHERGPLPFFGPVSISENRSAHGGTRWVEVCRCGCERDVLVNGKHRERGEWTERQS